MFSFNPLNLGGKCPRCGGAVHRDRRVYHCIKCNRSFTRTGALIVPVLGSIKFPGQENPTKPENLIEQFSTAEEEAEWYKAFLLRYDLDNPTRRKEFYAGK